MKSSKSYKRTEVEVLQRLFGEGDYLTEQYDVADVYFEKEDEITIAEYKTRNCKIKTYAQEGYVLEEKKAFALAARAKTAAEETGKKVRVLYINYFSKSGEVAVWDLPSVFKNRQFTKGFGMFNKRSATDFNGYGVKVEKPVYFLKPDSASEIIEMNQSREGEYRMGN